MNEELGQQSFRTHVRGSACSFHMPWEDILEDLRKKSSSSSPSSVAISSQGCLWAEGLSLVINRIRTLKWNRIRNQHRKLNQNWHVNWVRRRDWNKKNNIRTEIEIELEILFEISNFDFSSDFEFDFDSPSYRPGHPQNDQSQNQGAAVNRRRRPQ